MSVQVATIEIAVDPQAWREIGFAVDEGGRCQIGSVAIELTSADGERSFAGWTLAGLESAELDGLETEIADRSPAVPSSTDESPATAATAATVGGAEHPNGVIRLDHVVAFTPGLERTVAALEAGGLDLRRIREQPTPAGAPRQAFFRLGEVILEVVQQPESADGFDPSAPARLWGLAFVASDLDALAARLGDLANGPRDAVQEGRRILTLRRDAGAGVPVAFMSLAT